jgi:Uma2 family endonuclease
VDEHDLYPVHEEEKVPEKPQHELVARYLKNALAARFPDKWVTGDICMYWEEHNFWDHLAPDVLVVDCPTPDPLPNVYLLWSDPPTLFAVEIGSRSTFRRDEGEKPEGYCQDLRVPEYLYYHPRRRTLRLYRAREGGYDPVLPDGRGWMYSEVLDLWFGADEKGFLWAYTPAGERLLTHEEEARLRQEAEARAAAEARLHEEEARLRQEAEARAAAAERRLAELEAKLARRT